MMNAASPSPAASPPSGRSPALERRLRQRRADARVRLRLLSDCGLLAGHHASQPPRAASSATPVGEVAALRVLLGALALQLVEVRSEVAALRAASAPAEAATAPAPVDEAAAPAPVAEAATPAPVEEATSIDVEVGGGAPGQAAPAPVAEATAPAPVVVATAPAPLVEATSPAPAEEATAPAPVAVLDNSGPASIRRQLEVQSAARGAALREVEDQAAARRRRLEDHAAAHRRRLEGRSGKEGLG